MDLKDPEVKSFFMSVMLYGLKVLKLSDEDLPSIVQEFADWWVSTSTVTGAFVLEGKSVMIVRQHDPVCIINFNNDLITFGYDHENFESQYFVFSVIDTVKYFMAR